MHPSQNLWFADPRHDYDLWLTCEDCGDVFVHAELCSLRHDSATGEYSLRYACEQCGRLHALSLPYDDVEALRGVGFAVLPVTAPYELLEERPGGAVFGWNDMLSFHELLASTDLVADLVNGDQVGGAGGPLTSEPSESADTSD